MKIFTFFLPQFHSIPENDKWWGEGFSDWVNVKKAKPLFEGHNQPTIPLDKNYYDLSQTEVLKQQAILAKKYGVSGFCFYHYWFGGKLLLEKPVENFLKDKSIDIEFCLCWPTMTWTRIWSGNNEDILIEQKYGNEKNWEEHYNYLKDFFLDARYTKIDNKPVFIIYSTSEIPDLKKFLDYVNNLAVKDGFAGLFFVKINVNHEEIEDRYDFDAYVEFEPSLTMSSQTSKILPIKQKFDQIFNSSLKKVLPFTEKYYNLLWIFSIDLYKKLKSLSPFQKNKIFTLNYDKIWNDIINRKPAEKTFLGAFPSWDNSPRKNKRATIISGSTPTKFKNYLSKQIAKSIERKSDLLFINAWNEWAEGAYLEPDETNKFGYLEAVRDALKDNNL
jgi:hypothetical protein